MSSSFITRVERDKNEPYTVIFQTDDADKYKAIEDACRYAIGHAKTQFQEVVRCGECKYWNRFTRVTFKYERKGLCEYHGHIMASQEDFFCSDGERKEGAE